MIFSIFWSPGFWNNVLKLMLGYVKYSECRDFSLRRGNVQRNALAKRHAICSWLNDIDLFWPRFNSGIEHFISCGNCNANPIMPGNVLRKKDSASSSSSSWNMKGTKKKKNAKQKMIVMSKNQKYFFLVWIRKHPLGYWHWQPLFESLWNSNLIGFVF